jgi:hypothetical protein
MDEHEITIIRKEDREYPVTVDENGDIVVSELLGETIGITESSLYCSHCGHLSPDEYEDHGISDEWAEA